MPPEDSPAFRYSATLANEIERRWQDRWEKDGTYHAPNPMGPLSDGWERLGDVRLTARARGASPVEAELVR